MIKFSKSTMHEQNVLMFFRGEKIAKSGNYVFEESLFFFAEENLAPNLIEYDLTSEGTLDLNKNPKISKIISNLEASSGQKLSVVDVKLSDSKTNFDLALEYNESVFDWVNLETIKGPLVDVGHFKVDFRKIDSNDTGNILGVDRNKMSYIRALVSRDFLKDRRAQLSEELQVRFDPKRYVDTQILFFLLGSALSGITRAEEKRRNAVKS